MTRHRMWPARASSAIPQRAIPESAAGGDVVVETGKLWEKHREWCPKCHPAAPGCDLGRQMYATYVWAADSEGRQ